jgi:hypothetical protein
MLASSISPGSLVRARPSNSPSIYKSAFLMMRKIFAELCGFNINWLKRTIRVLKTARKFSLFFFVSLIFLFIFIAASGQEAAAQVSEEGWVEPINLSHSGGTTNPQMVIDSYGKIHVIWEDLFEGYFYTFHEVNTWSSPVRVIFPFDGFQPLLLAGQDELIHAFWIDEEERLQHSQVSADLFDDEEAWQSPEVVGASAVNFDALIDTDNKVHVVYVRPLQTTSSPAGIYYKNTADGGENWSSAENLYSSSYMRGVSSDTSHISISSTASGSETKIFVAWDNRSRRQVFLTHSNDGGEEWNEPQVIDHPRVETGAGQPLNILVSSQGENVLLIWQIGISEMSCSQYYMFSNDGGRSWSERLPLPSPLPACPKEQDLLHVKQGINLLLAEGDWQGYIQAWNGQEWSDGSSQSLISTFEDPDVFESVALQCRQSAYHSIYDRLFIVGCDPTGGGDIWISSLFIGDVDHWYPEPSVWSPPQAIRSSENNLSSLVMAGGNEDSVHVIWVENVSANTGLNPSNELMYSRLYGGNWTRPTAIPVLSGVNPASPTITIDYLGRLLMAWEDNHNGKIYFQWSNASHANRPTSWTTVVEIPSIYLRASSPHIIAGADGYIYVIYAVSLNEERGIYLTRSHDRGESWSQPVLVFDAVAAGWEKVDSPRLTIDHTGTLHTLFVRNSLPGGRGPLELYYSRSTDGGENWSIGEPVVEKPVLWSRIVSAGDRGLHRTWLEVEAGRRQVYHQYSMDSGKTWSRAEVLSNQANEGVIPDLVVDSANRLHMLKASRDIFGVLSLYHWQWDGVFWYANENISLNEFRDQLVTGFYSAMTPSGTIKAVFSTTNSDKSQPLVSLSSIFFTSRSIDIPDTLLEPVSVPQSQVDSTPEPNQISTPSLTPTIDLSVFQGNSELLTDTGQARSGLFGLLIGGTLATVIVGVAFVVGIRIVKRRN